MDFKNHAETVKHLVSYHGAELSRILEGLGPLGTGELSEEQSAKLDALLYEGLSRTKGTAPFRDAQVETLEGEVVGGRPSGRIRAIPASLRQPHEKVASRKKRG